MVEFSLMNGKKVDVSQEEINEFITQVLMANPYWRHSGLLGKDELLGYLQGKKDPKVLRKIARYILIYFENQSFTAWLFDKSTGETVGTKEFNMPILKKLRDIYQGIIQDRRSPEELAGDVHEMENACMEMGSDPL